MRLSRRDALAALTAAGIGVGGVMAYHSETIHRLRATDSDSLETMMAVAETIYPSKIEVTTEFIETYVFGRIEDDPKYAEEIVTAADALNGQALDHAGNSFTNLEPDKRDALLHKLGLHETEANPDGPELEYIRYFVVDELLFALFTTPDGGKLVGTENPTGHPGGLDSYQRGTMNE